MASRRISQVPSTLKNVSSDAKSLKSGSNAANANNSGTTKKSVGTKSSVKSRYLQAAEKASLSKSNSLTSESLAGSPKPSSPKPIGVRSKVGTPPRRSMAPQALGMSRISHETEPSLLGKSVLQSTFSHGHCFRPEFDISAIKEKTILESAVEADKNPENEKRIIEMQTFLLAYLTAKMESNTSKLKAEAEARLLEEMEEEELLHSEVQAVKSQYLLKEKTKLMNELLDLQISALTPVAEATNQFTKEYTAFATSVDATRHELPVKNYYIAGDRREFLDKAEDCLKESERLLRDCTEGEQQDNSVNLECLKNMKNISKDISQQLSGTFSELLELSSLVCRHTVQVQQATEEERLGTARIQELFCPRR